MIEAVFSQRTFPYKINITNITLERKFASDRTFMSPQVSGETEISLTRLALVGPVVLVAEFVSPQLAQGLVASATLFTAQPTEVVVR